MLKRAIEFAPLIFLCLCVLYLHARVRTLGYMIEELKAESLVNALRDEYAAKAKAVVVAAAEPPACKDTMMPSPSMVFYPVASAAKDDTVRTAIEERPATAFVVADEALPDLEAEAGAEDVEVIPIPTKVCEIQPADIEIDAIAAQKKANASEAAKLRAVLRSRGQHCKGSLEELRVRVQELTSA
jgi:hypothetical protein